MSSELIKTLRERTGAGMMDCKKALEETGNDLEKASDLLRQKGIAKASKKADRVAKEGYIGTYLHANNRIGVMVEVNCETDFVARNSDFQAFVKDVAMHIAASNPLAVSEDQLDPAVLAKEREIYLAQAKEEGKPANIAEKMVEGRVKKFKQESVLLSQEFVKNPDMTVEDLLKSTISKIGENLVIRRFVRFEVGM